MLAKNRRLIVVGIATLVAASLALGETLASQGLREQDVKREFGYLTLRDGAKLAYVTYRPINRGPLSDTA